MFKTFEDYISNTTQTQRQLHIDLNSECSFKSKKGKTFTSDRRSRDAARENIIEFLISEGILDPSLETVKFGKEGKVQANHLCNCSNDSGVVCNNPKHIYLGTAKENWHDINPNTGKTALEQASETFKTDEHKEKRSIGQKLAWEERKLRFLQSDKT